MSLDLGAAATAELSKTVTYPIYLIQCGFGPQEFNSTGADITTLGQSWIGGGLDFSGSTDSQAVNVIIDNSDFSLSQSVIDGDPRGAAVDIWYCVISPQRYLDYAVYESGIYESGIYALESTIPLEVIKTVKLFSGEIISAANAQHSEITLTAQRRRIQSKISPSVKMAPPVFNHLPAAGTVVELGNETLVIE